MQDDHEAPEVTARRVAIARADAQVLVEMGKEGRRLLEVINNAYPEDAQVVKIGAWGDAGVALFIQSAEFDVVPDGETPPLLEAPEVVLQSILWEDGPISVRDMK